MKSPQKYLSIDMHINGVLRIKLKHILLIKFGKMSEQRIRDQLQFLIECGVTVNPKLTQMTGVSLTTVKGVEALLKNGQRVQRKPRSGRKQSSKHEINSELRASLWNISKAYYESLIKSMPKGIEMCIAADFDHINY